MVSPPSARAQLENLLCAPSRATQNPETKVRGLSGPFISSLEVVGPGQVSVAEGPDQVGSSPAACELSADLLASRWAVTRAPSIPPAVDSTRSPTVSS